MSEALTLLLDSSGSPDAAARQIAENPVLCREAKAVVRDLQRVATAKAGADGVKAVIGRRFSTYPQPARSEAEAAAWWMDYYETLADQSLASLEAAMRAYVARPDSEFMPKPGKLLELASTTPCRSLQRYYRAKRAIQFAVEADTPLITGPRVDPQDVKTMLAEYEAKTAGAAVRLKPEPPSTAGKPDAGGLTKEMRELMARRQGLGG